jgi:antitoxin CptB
MRTGGDSPSELAANVREEMQESVQESVPEEVRETVPENRRTNVSEDRRGEVLGEVPGELLEDVLETEARHRAFWHSRRGMLELEFQLVPFARNCFSSLSREQRNDYVRLLAHEDWEIFDWLQGRETPPDAALEALVRQIIVYNSVPRGPL